MSRPRILLLVTGGTITMTRQADGSIVPTLSGEELVASVPGLSDVAEIVIQNFSTIPSASLTLENLVRIAQSVEARLQEDFAGAIVVQGTDTIEETAFVLDRLVRSDKPVVVTGAMRGPQAASADGPGNLLAASIVAGSQEARGLGTLVVLNDEVHAGRFVRKMHTGLLSAFGSPHQGPLGYVIENSFKPLVRLVRSTPLPVPDPEAVAEAPVALIPISLGDDGRILDALPGLGYVGAVIKATGAGHVPACTVERLDALAQKMPVVLCTRVISGPVFTRTYGYPGSESDLISRGLIPSHWVSGAKAKLLLRLALANKTPTAELVALFNPL